MSDALLFVRSLLATIVLTVLPGWPLANWLSFETRWLGSAVLSLAVLFTASLALSFLGAQINWLTLAPWQAALFGFGWWLHRRHPRPSPIVPSSAPLPRWLLMLALAAGGVLLARAWQQPLLGYDNCFRWDRLARIVASTGSLTGYPARTLADYAAYFYPDSVPPLVSLCYAEIYSLVGRAEPAATAWFVAWQGFLLALIAWQLARALAGDAAGHGGLLAACAAPLLFWCVLMGQETGLTALSLGAMLWWLDRSAHTGRASETVLAGLAAGLGAASREYGGAFCIVGLATAWWLGLGAKRIVWFGLTAALLAGPWYLRVWHLTGNPFYPLKLGGIFPFNEVHEAMFAELRLKFAWSVLPWRERLRALGTLVQLAPLAVLAGAWGLWQTRRRAPWLGAGVAVSVALWRWGMSVVAGGTYISLRMLSPALLLLSVAAGVGLATLATKSRAITYVAATLALAVLPNFLTMPLMAKSLPLHQWLDGLRATPRTTAAISPGERAILDLPGKILTDDPYVHSWIAERGAGAKVVPVWSHEFEFLFDPKLGADEQLARLRAAEVHTVVLWPDVVASRYLKRQPWAQVVLATWPQIAPGYYHDGAQKNPRS